MRKCGGSLCLFGRGYEKLYNIIRSKYKLQCIYDPCSYPGIQCKYYYNPEGDNNTNGIIALIFGLLGFFNVVPIVGSILGIVFGAIGRKKDDGPKMAIAGLVLGIIGIVVWVAFYIWIFSFIFMAFRYIPD